MFCHIVCRLHIYNTLVYLTTYTLRLNNVVVEYYHIIVFATGKHFIFAINQYKGKFDFINGFKNVIVFIASITAGSSCFWVLRLLHIFLFQQPNPNKMVANVK